MNRNLKILYTSILMLSLGFGLTACIGYVGDSGGYRDRGWHDDGPWMGGPRGYIGIGIHPDRH